MIEDQVRGFIANELHGPSGLSVDFALIEGGVIDSLGIMHLVGFIESEYGITVDDLDLVPDNFGSIGAIARFVESKRSQVGPVAP